MEKWHRAEVSVDWELCSREREEREGDPGCDTGVVRDLRPEPAAGAESGEGTPVWRERGSHRNLETKACQHSLPDPRCMVCSFCVDG